MRNGDKDLDGLIASIDKGILVTGFNGGNCNSTTGDFSYGVEGFLIERGKLSQPISEMNATGNMLSLWSNLAEVGNDPAYPPAGESLPCFSMGLILADYKYKKQHPEEQE